MPLLGYQKEFAALVEFFIKRQTVRATRKRPFKAGDRLYHYSGLRTKQCRKLLETDCISVADILIDKKGDVYIDGRCMFESMKESFAFADGFRPLGEAWARMLEFVKMNHGLPFKGQLIKW